METPKIQGQQMVAVAEGPRSNGYQTAFIVGSAGIALAALYFALQNRSDIGTLNPRLFKPNALSLTTPSKFQIGDRMVNGLKNGAPIAGKPFTLTVDYSTASGPCNLSDFYVTLGEGKPVLAGDYCLIPGGIRVEFNLIAPEDPGAYHLLIEHGKFVIPNGKLLREGKSTYISVLAPQTR